MNLVREQDASKRQSIAFKDQLPSTILLIDAQRARRYLLERALSDSGYLIVLQQETADQLCFLVELHQPDVIVIGIDGPDPATLNNLLALKAARPTPIVMFAEDEAPQVIQQTIKTGVSAYIIDDIQPSRIKSIITVAYVRFIEHQLLSEELVKTQSALANRKILDKAKGLLMHKSNITEDKAFNMIRKMSMDKGLPIATVAGNIIELMALLDVE